MLHSFARHLRQDTHGSTAIEFAIIGPAFIALLLGVLQFGIALQAYNAVRNVSADVARHVAVQFQVSAGSANGLNDTTIERVAISRAISAPYLLNELNIRVNVEDAPVQRVAGATEKTISIEYDVPTVMPLFGFSGPTVSYDRPIFYTNN